MKYFIYFSRICSGDILRETAANVWIQRTGYHPERIFKRGSTFAAFNTFDEAKAEMIARKKAIIAKLEREIQSKREDLAELEAKKSIN